MSKIEIIAALFGLLGVAASTIPHAANWPLNLVSSILYMYFFYTLKLYSDSILQIYYVVTSVIGWMKWTKGDPMSFRNAIPITYLSKQQLSLSILTVALMSFAVGHFFAVTTDASLPYFDASVAVLSLLGQWLSTQKKMDSWPIWALVNCASVVLYSLKDAYVTAALYFIFLIMTILGWRRWLKITAVAVNR